MPVRDLDELAPGTRAVVRDYLDRVAKALKAEQPEVAEETESELLDDLKQMLSAQSSPDDARALAAQLGIPESTFEEAQAETPGTLLGGRLMGMPFSVGLPTADYVGSRWWDPASPQIFKPRIFGLGWSVNFGAVAVKLNLIEADAEDEPFTSVPDAAFVLALFLPVALTAFVLSSWVALRGSLPPQLPVHWGISGRPDDFAAATVAWLMQFAVAALPTAWACGAVLLRRKKMLRASVTGMATLLATLSAVLWAQALLFSLANVVVAWLVPVGIIAGFVLAFGVTLALARVGRAAEIKRELSR